MKNISKTFEIIVALSLCTAMITSCASNRKNSKTDVTVTDTTTEQNEIITTETAAKSELITTESTTNIELSTHYPRKKISDMPTIEEQVLVDNETVKITAKEFIVYDRYDESIKVYVENKSEEAFDLKCGDIIVNDYICHSYSQLSLKAGEKSAFEIGFNPQSHYIEKAFKIGEIRLRFSLFESGSYNVIQESDWITINASDIEVEKDKTDVDGITLFDQGGIKIIATENDGFDLDSASIWVYVENNTDNDIYIDSKDSYVNGYMVDGSIMKNNIYAHSKRLTYIDFYYYQNPDKEKIGIIDEVGVSFEIKDNNDIILMDTEKVNFSAKDLKDYDYYINIFNEMSSQ